MKKFIAVTIFITLFAYSVFAQINLSGSVSGGATLLKGSNVRGDILQAGNFLAGSIEADGQNESNTFGGNVRINAEASTIDPAAWNWSASAWWRPLYFMKLQVGYVEDLALTEIIGWGYHGNDADSFVVYPAHNYAGDYFSDSTGFYTGTGINWVGASLTLTPVYGLDISLAVPFGRGAEVRDKFTGNLISKYNAADAYRYSAGQIAYSLYGVGRLAFTFAGGGNGRLEKVINAGNVIVVDPNDPDKDEDYNPFGDLPGAVHSLQMYRLKANAHSIYASFLLTAFEDFGLGANIGFAYTLPVKDKYGNVTYNNPMEVGLGFSFIRGKFGIRARAAASFLGSIKRQMFTDISGVTNLATGIMHEPLMMGLGILPYYTTGPFMFYLNAGVSYKFADEIMDEYGKVVEYGNSTALGWYVNPYMTFTIGSGTFYAGIQIGSDGLKYTGYNKDNMTAMASSGLQYYPGQPIIDWAVPIGIQFSF